CELAGRDDRRHRVPLRDAGTVLRVMTSQRNFSRTSHAHNTELPAEQGATVTMRPPVEGTDTASPIFSSLDDLRAACLDLPPGDLKAAAVAAERQRQLTKPPGSLGRLEDGVVWLAQWQGRSSPPPRRVDTLGLPRHHRAAG